MEKTFKCPELRCSIRIKIGLSYIMFFRNSDKSPFYDLMIEFWENERSGFKEKTWVSDAMVKFINDATCK